MNPTQTPDNSNQGRADRFEKLVSRDSGRDRSRLEAIGAALALVGLVFGVPLLLWATTGPPPIPSRLPGVQRLLQQLSFEDVLTVLVGVVWLAWLFFVVSVVLELIAARSGGLAQNLPMGGPVQRLARSLVGALLLSGLMAVPAQAADATADVSAASQQPVAVGLSQVSMEPEETVLEADLQDRKEAAAAAAEERAYAAAGDKVYTVAPPQNGYHDNLWDIAERHLGDGRRYTEIYELNKNKEQSDGRKLELARLIQPGWELVMPRDAKGVESVPAPAPAQSTTTPVSAQTVADNAADIAADDSVFEAVGGWKAGSGLLAAAILGALALARRRRVARQAQEHAREVEANLRVAATTDRVTWLDAALRQLGEACRTANVSVPQVHAVYLSDTSVDLLISPESTVGVDGWTVHDEGRRWQTTRDADSEIIANSGAVPYPALVSLGVDDQQRDVLIDLEAAGGIVTVTGSPHVASQVASSVAIQAATSPWSTSVQVMAHALPPGIADLNAERLSVAEKLDDQLDSLADHVESFPDDVLNGRISRRAPVPSQLVVSGLPPEHQVASRLGELAGQGSRALSVLMVGDHPAARWKIRVDDAGNLDFPQLGVSVTANRVGVQQVEAVAELFRASQEPDQDPTASELPENARMVDRVAWSTAKHRVAVLGTVVVDGVPNEIPRIDQSTEIVTYLVMHPEPVHPNIVGAAVWPRGVTADVVEAAVGRARDWLGTDSEGSHLLREDAEGRLSLASSVVSDWDAVVTLIAEARKAVEAGAEADLLKQALGFVRGEPFEAVPRGRYSWVAREDLPRSMTKLLIASAERLVALLGDDPDAAAIAAEQGLMTAPWYQPLWCSLLRARSQTEGVVGVQRTLEDMGDQLRGIPLNAETEALIDELLPPTPGQAASA